MNISCSICTDFFTPSSETHVTKCGHVFHSTCLMQWMERSEKCPQCPRITKNSTYRIYFDLENGERTDEDAMLAGKVDSLKHQLSQMENDLMILRDKCYYAQLQRIGLRNEKKEQESKIKPLMYEKKHVKETVNYFKVKAKDFEPLYDEVIRLKDKIREAEHIETEIDRSSDQVNDMLRHNSDVPSLRLQVTKLKRDLIRTEKKRKLALKHAQNDVIRYRKDLSDIEHENNKMKTDFESHSSCGLKIQYLKEKLLNMETQLQTTASCLPNRLNRTVTESPVPFQAYSCVNSDEIINVADAPTLVENVTTLDSNLKSSNVGLPCLGNAKFTTVSQTSQRNPNTDFNIFEPEPTKVDNVKSCTSNCSSDGACGPMWSE